jgi:hypothetical protein
MVFNIYFKCGVFKYLKLFKIKNAVKTNNKSYDAINKIFFNFVLFLDCISHVQLHLQILDDKFLSVWRIFPM